MMEHAAHGDHQHHRFDEAAATWDDDPDKLRLSDSVAATITDRVPLQPDWVALDFGAGTGQLSLRLADRLAAIDLIDTSPGMVEQARQRVAGHPGLQVVHADLATEPAPRPHYDLVMAQLSLHHVPDLDGMLDIFSQLLTPDGWVAIAELSHDPEGAFHARVHGFTGHHGFDPDDLGGRLARRGFTQIDHIACGTATRSHDGQSREFGVNLVTGRLA